MKLYHSHLLQVAAAANQEGLGNDTVHSCSSFAISFFLCWKKEIL